jgi:hypothetical protein
MLKTFALHDGNQNDKQVGILKYDVESKIYYKTFTESISSIA